ncbi:MAG: hemolysin III family protein [Prevotella sp.]|nr:hemolysin III family protein [Prevotella sp.]
MKKKIIEEKGNTWTHLIGVVFALSCIWMVWPAVSLGWRWAMGVLFFIVGMFLMFLSSTIYHWLKPGIAKNILRKCDHISIYVMIACSYTPICIAVVGGWIGWVTFGLLWAVVIAGTVYKIVAMGKYPRLSLALYLVMGWSIVFIAKPVFESLSVLSMFLIFAEGVLYTAGTYFFTKDSKPHFHAIWHVFVLLGAIAHWSAILTIMLGY